MKLPPALLEFLRAGLDAETTDPILLRRVQIVAASNLVLLVLGGPFFFQYRRIGLEVMEWALAACLGVCVLSLVLLRTLRRPRVSANLTLTALYGMLLVSNVCSGGFYDPNFSWFYIIPLAAVVGVDLRTGWFWTGVVITTTLVFWSLPEFGIVLPNLIPVEHVAVQSLSNRLVEIIAILFLATSFVFTERLTAGRLAQSNVQLEREVAERAAAEQAALAADRAKSAFLATMSHEIRTPLNGVLGLGGLLLETQLDSHQRRLVETLRNSGEGLLSVLNEILDFSRLESTEIRIESAEIDPVEVACEVADLLATTRIDTRVDLTVRVGKTVPPRVVGDLTHLRQVLSNLIGNALKFTDEGEIVVRIERVSDGLEFIVEDTGIGIPRHRLEQLFEPFTQADSSTVRRFGGTGLGLAIARRLCQAMGGDLTATAREGRGSTFVASLPFPPSDAEPTSPLRDQRIAVSVRSPTVHAGLVSLLERLGADVFDPRLDLRSEAEPSESGAPHPSVDLLFTDRAPDARDTTCQADLVIAVQHQGEEAPAWPYFRRLTLPPRLDTLASFAAMDSTGEVALVPHLRLGERPPRVLVAEDHPVNQWVTRAMLESMGCTVEVAADGQEALVTLGQRPFDLVVMDCQMPQLDGYTATRALRRREQAADDTSRPVPVIGLSAGAQPEDRARALESGMDEYLVKPVPQEALRRALEAHLDGLTSVPAPPAARARRRAAKPAALREGASGAFSDRRVAQRRAADREKSVATQIDGAAARRFGTVPLRAARTASSRGHSSQNATADSPLGRNPSGRGGSPKVHDGLSIAERMDLASRGATASSPFDPQRIAELPGAVAIGPPALAERYLDLFFRHLPEQLASTRAAIERGDVGGVREQLHRLRGSAAFLQLESVDRLRRELHAEANDLAATSERLDAFERELDSVRQALLAT